MPATELVEDVVQQNDLYDDDGTFGDDGDDWDFKPSHVEVEWASRSSLASKSDIEENEE